IDLVEDPFKRKQLQLRWPDALFISAYCKDDIFLLKNKIGEIVVEYNKQRQMESIISYTTKSYIKRE
ncbi:MAG: hypothetical protein N2053_11825, partial [Chitinispirillaceae bacterium]|nr:hypothetical protein [Chitinispirillaceae bacterium]